MRVVVFLALSGGVILTGQSLLPKRAFEVVSVRPGTQGTRKSLKRSGNLRERIDDARVDLGSQTLSYLIQIAYRLPEERISGPSWMDDARFDVLAKLPAGASKNEVPEMLQTMLAERFRLTVHREEKIFPAYALMAGKGPLRLTQSHDGDSSQEGCDLVAAPHHICRNITMEQLAAFLTQQVHVAGPDLAWAPDRPVIDATGLKGAWNFTMDFGFAVAPGRNEADALPVGNAIRELGLRLEPVKHPFETLVIDHIERVPTEN